MRGHEWAEIMQKEATRLDGREYYALATAAPIADSSLTLVIPYVVALHIRSLDGTSPLHNVLFTLFTLMYSIC